MSGLLSRRAINSGLIASRFASQSPASAKHSPEWPKKGVNLSKITMGDLRFSLSDLENIKRAGFSLIRMPFTPQRDRFGNMSAPIAKIAEAAAYAREVGLQVILDAHFDGNSSSETISKFDLMSLWTKISLELDDYSDVIFELMNEPPKYREGWWDIQEDIIHLIRSICPARVIIASSAPFANLYGLTAQAPYNSRDIIYNFHYYSPMIFTHQGASWASPALRDAHDIRYPTIVLSGENAELWDKSRIRTDLEPLHEWALRYEVKVICGEFGVYDHAASTDRLLWLSDVRLELEANGFAWCVWELKGGFGIAGDNGEISGVTRKALGLNIK
jgi:endoglucanase